MAYTRNIGTEFWYEFDNLFMWDPTSEASDAIRRAYDFGGTGPNFDFPVDLLRVSYGAADHPASFLAGVNTNRVGLIDLARLQIGMIEAHLSTVDEIQASFEDFAQGVLFDTRRLVGWKVHKMDGSPEDWVGYQRWNAFARAMQLLGERPADWLHLNRCIALAWAIQTEARPDDDSPTNPGLPASRLAELRATWMSAAVEVLDWAFTSHRYHAPTPVEVQAKFPVAAAPTGYARVQQILQTATPSGNPLHKQGAVPQGRFWLKPYDEFIALTIYGKQLISAPGPNRGENSALVKALRGTLPGFPRMPKFLPAVTDPDIQFISEWIDAGALEH